MSNTKKAFLFSVVLHVALLTGLGMLRPSFELGVGASPRYLEISFANGTARVASGASTESPVATAAAAESAADAAEPPPAAASEADAATADNPAPAPVTAGPAAPDRAATTASPPVPSPEPAATPPPAIAATATATAVAGANPAPERPPAGQLPAAQTADNAPDAVLVAAVAEPPSAVAIATGSSEPPSTPTLVTGVEREPIAATEAEVLEARIEDWAGSFAALGEFGTTAVWEDSDGTYEATVTHEPGAGSSGYDEAIVMVSTMRDGRKLSTRVRMQRLGFSHYAQFIDRWDPSVQIHDDEIDGRFHSNSDIFIQRSGGVQPTFLGKVTTARSIDTSRSERRIDREQVFLGGLETRVGRIPLPPRLALFGDDGPDPDSVLELVGDTAVRFHRDGTFTWKRLLSRREERQLEDQDSPSAVPVAGSGALPDAAPFYIVAAEDSDIHVAGVVDGQVLVYSPEDIVIDDDLVYAAHPTQSVSSDDYLGLVAEGNVEIADAGSTGSGDLEVHAAIYARSRFAVRGFRGASSGELRVVGSITAGSLTATEPRFSTRLMFDHRLADTRPPAFPLTDRYEIADWDGAWTVEP